MCDPKTTKKKAMMQWGLKCKTKKMLEWNWNRGGLGQMGHFWHKFQWPKELETQIFFLIWNHKLSEITKQQLVFISKPNWAL